jgi:hypothetical protein
LADYKHAPEFNGGRLTAAVELTGLPVDMYSSSDGDRQAS